MPRVGGVYSLPPGYFATDGTTIVVSQHNPPLEDIAQALTDSLPRDGSAPMTGSLNMGTKKITNLAAATNPADAVRFDQISDPAAIALATLQTYGWAIVGNAPTLANIDATTTASGQYRFIAGASGTFPTGVVAADTGQITMIRETTNEGSMTMEVGAGRRFWRALVAGVWGAWQEILMIPASASTGILVRNAAGTATVRQITSSDSSVAITNPAGVAGDINLTTVSPIKAYANFSGVPVSGTYSRTGTLVTVTLAAHGMTTGHFAYLDFTSGTATDGYYQITSTGANTFTVVDAASGATSGNVTRNIWTRKSFNIASIVRQTTARYQATFATAFADADYIFIGHAGEVSNRITEAVSINALGTLPTTTTVTFYAGDTGANGVPSSTGVDNAYVHFVVFA